MKRSVPWAEIIGVASVVGIIAVIGSFLYWAREDSRALREQPEYQMRSCEWTVRQAMESMDQPQRKAFMDELTRRVLWESAELQKGKPQ